MIIQMETEGVMDRVVMETKNTGDSREVQVTIATEMIVKGRNTGRHIKNEKWAFNCKVWKAVMQECVVDEKIIALMNSIFVFFTSKVKFESHVYVVYQ